MRTALILLAAVTICACSAPRQIAVTEGDIPQVQVHAPPAAPRPVPPAALAPIADPLPVLEAPRGSIEGRAHYPDPRYTEWVLTNGMTVVYKQVSHMDHVWALAFAAGEPSPMNRSPGSHVEGAYRVDAWPMVHVGLRDGERLLVAQAPSLDAALYTVAGLFNGEWTAASQTSVPWGLVLSEGRSGEIRPGHRMITEGASPDFEDAATGGIIDPRSLFRIPAAYTVVLAGAEDPVVAEGLVGTTLGEIRARGDSEDADRKGKFEVGSVQPTSDAPSPAIGIHLRTTGAERDAPVLDVLAAAVHNRLLVTGQVSALHAHVHPRTGAVRLDLFLSESPTRDAIDVASQALSAFTDAEVQQARRDAASDFLAPSPRQWVRLLADLYRVDGAYRPARNPVELSRYSARIAAVSAASVNALAGQLRRSLPRSHHPVDPAP